jgi:DNA recombination protein RmuC
MRRTVDEKLQGTLDTRLGESFKLVSDRLEQVHKGLGEMQTLATGVGDLKRVLTNVKTRGTWSEMQLANLLEQILTPDQYDHNVQTKPTGQETVEFAIKLPGREDDGKVVWLPIDAKFPKEDYERLVDAAELGDADGIEKAAKALKRVCAHKRATFATNILRHHTQQTLGSSIFLSRAFMPRSSAVPDWQIPFNGSIAL